MKETNTKAAAAPPERRAPRILVVDDERSMRELLAIVLKREGYDVLLADSGRAAIDALEHEQVDLLISDIKMPDLSGVDVPSGEVWYEADEGQIRQIVWNLATNGLRAMPNGGRLRLMASLESDGVVITVQDEGIGIPPEELDSLFQPFHGNFTKGSGLGLAIVHRIVTDYHGEIQVSSRPGAGTTVSVRLPARAVATA